MTKSFCLDHTTLQPGFYWQEEREGIQIYDWRIFAPSDLMYLGVEANHTLEHYLANFLNEKPEYHKIAIYPYGCLTGFGLALKTYLEPDQREKLLLDLIAYILENHEIPGNSIYACGNPRTLNYESLIPLLIAIKLQLDLKQYSWVYLDQPEKK